LPVGLRTLVFEAGPRTPLFPVSDGRNQQAERLIVTSTEEVTFYEAPLREASQLLALLGISLREAIDGWANKLSRFAAHEQLFTGADRFPHEGKFGLADGMLALPSLPLLVVLAALDPGKIGLPRDFPAFDLARIVVIIALFGWPGVARLARATALSLLGRDFLRAAIALGATPVHIAWRHVAPNLLAPVGTAATLAVGGTILTESVLSFLGLGIQPPTASWGNMLANAQEMVFAAPLQAVWPGAAIFITVVCCNVVGDGLRRRA
jgi:hypothetical protein